MSLSLAPIRDLGLAVLVSNGVSDESQALDKQVQDLGRRRTLAESARPRTVEERFQELAQQWKRERGPYSFTRQLASHPAYQQIIGLGQAAVPHILRELETQPDHWFWALSAITGADPVRPEHRGKLRLMAGDWINWGRARGF